MSEHAGAFLVGFIWGVTLTMLVVVAGLLA